MKRLATLVFAAAALAMASAQIAQMVDREKMVATPLMMLQHAAVQKELKMSGKQRDEIKKINADFTNSMADLQKQNNIAAFTKANEEAAATEAKMLAVLDDAQSARFKEIRYQVLGMRSLGEPEVQAALALTKEQKSAIADFEKAARQGALSAMRGGPSALDRWNKGRDKREEELAKILTPEQDSKLKAMFGAPFKDVKKVRG